MLSDCNFETKNINVARNHRKRYCDGMFHRVKALHNGKIIWKSYK